MSTRDIAIEIFNKLSEEQLEFFIKAFGSFVDDDVQDERYAAYLAVKNMRKKNPDIDYDKELAEYREEKFGH